MKREEQIIEASQNCIYTVPATPRSGFMDGARWADANQPNPWISVEEKLPDDGVLVIVAYRVRLGEILYGSDVFHIDYGWESYDDIVAWMPIPQLPKEIEP